MRNPQPDLSAREPSVRPEPGRRRVVQAAVALPLLGLVSACAPRRPLILAGRPWPGYEPIFLAHTLGYLPKQVRLMEPPSHDAMISLLKAGEIDGVMLTLDQIIQLRDEGTDLTIVLVFDISKGADVLLARPGLTRLASLRGRRIGLVDSALGHLMLSMTLEKAGLRPGDVQPRLIAYEHHDLAWARGEVDALLTYEPMATKVRKLGGRPLLSTRDLPDTIFDVLAVRPAALLSHGEVLREALAGHFRALTYLRQNPWDSAYRIATRLEISAEDLIGSLRGMELPDLIGNQRYLSARDGDLHRVTTRLSAIMLQAGIIRRPADLEALYTGAYLPGAPAT